MGRVNAEKLVSDYLRERLELRVMGKPPGDTDPPWIMVTQLDAPQNPIDPADHLVDYMLQLDCYASSNKSAAGSAAGGQAQAAAIMREVCDALVVIDQAEHDLGVVTGARILSSLRLPDSSNFEPARERYVVTASVWAHA